jgi:hypothetical protein
MAKPIDTPVRSTIVSATALAWSIGLTRRFVGRFAITSAHA